MKIIGYFGTLLGVFKLCLYKILYGKKLSFYIGKDIPRVTIDTKIVIVGKGRVVLGKRFSCRHNCTLRANNGNIKIGDNVFFNDGVSINSQNNVEIGNCIRFGHNVLIYDHNHDYKKEDYINKNVMKLGEVCINNNVWICANTVILPNVNIANDCVVAAGTIVKSGTNLPSGKLLYNERKDIIKEINIEKE